MGNTATAQGQLQRSGVQRLISDKRGKKKRVKASGLKFSKERRIAESFSGVAFREQGKDEKQKTPEGAVTKGRVYLVTIIEEGLGNSKDKNYYSPEALQQGIQLWNGAKAYCDHPDAISEKTLPERSMRDMVGWYSDVFTDKNPTSGKVRLRGKLHFFPDAKWLTDKIDIILKDPTAQKLFGISINAIGKTRPATMNGEEVNYVEEFQRVDSADVVTEPAARGGFDKMLESRRNRSEKVSKSVMKHGKRTREAAALSPEKTKEIADSLVSAYNSDNPDELKQAAFDAAKQLHGVSSISGKGPGQVNEEQYSNINPSGGSTEEDEMAKPKLKASRRTRASAGGSFGMRKGKRRVQAAAGTGEDNEDVGEPEPSDIPNELEEGAEADVEDEEERGNLGDQSEFGGGSKYRTVKASASRRGREDEGLEDEGLEGLEDEGLEDEGAEDEDEMMPSAGGAAGGGGAPSGAGAAGPTGGGAPGSSRAIASEAGDSDSDDSVSNSDSDDLGEMDESEANEFERPNVVSEARRRRQGQGRSRSHEAEASFSGGLGKAGHEALPDEVDETLGYEDRDRNWGKSDDSTSGVGKSYKIKTSRFARNRATRRVVKPVVREANRRIEKLTGLVLHLRESNRAKDRKITLYRGKMRFMESSKSATALLREAVKDEILSVPLAREMYPQLVGLNRDEQIREIRKTARLLESAQEGAVARLTDVDGVGARGSVVFRESAGAEDSELVAGLAGDGVPMKKEE